MIRSPRGPPGPAIVWRRPVAWGVLALIMVISAGLVWVWSSHLTLLGDEWGYAFRTATEPTSEYLLHPPLNKHLIAVPLLLYKGAFDGFGITSDAPYRLGHIVILLLCAGLFYALARRRIGDSLAVLPTAVLLFLGTAWEAVAIPLRSPSLLAIAAGLGMLLALERRDLKGDAAACALLALGLASHSTAFAFAAAAVVLILSRPPPERWSRLWVFALPIAAYAIWWLLAFDPGESRSVTSTVVDLPAYLAEALGDTLLATAGLHTHAKYGGIDVQGALKTALTLALVALLAWVVIARFRRARSTTPFALSMIAALLVFWLATAFAPGPSRPPGTSRYLYPDAVLFLLLLCEFGRDFQLPRGLTPRVVVAVLTLFTISLAGNIYELRVQERAIDAASDRMRAGLTSLALDTSSAPPGFNLDTTLAGRFPASDLIPGLAPSTLALIFEKYGNPAYSPAELASHPQSIRSTADYVSLRLARSELRPVRGPPAQRPKAPALEAIRGRWDPDSHRCLALRPTGRHTAGLISVPGGSLSLSAHPGSPVTVSAGRFAGATAVPIGSLPGGNAAALELPVSSGAPDWRVGIHTAQRVLACPG